MSKPPRGLGKIWVGIGCLGTGAVMLVIGVAARGLGAPMSVFFIFLGLLAVFGVLALAFAFLGAREFKRANYGIRIRPAPADQKDRNLP